MRLAAYQKSTRLIRHNKRSIHTVVLPPFNEPGKNEHVNLFYSNVVCKIIAVLLLSISKSCFQKSFMPLRFSPLVLICTSKFWNHTPLDTRVLACSRVITLLFMFCLDAQPSISGAHPCVFHETIAERFCFHILWCSLQLANVELQGNIYLPHLRLLNKFCSSRQTAIFLP